MKVSNHTNANGEVAVQGIEWELLPFSFIPLNVGKGQVAPFRIFDSDGVFYECSLDLRDKHGRFLSVSDVVGQAFGLFRVFFGGDQRYLELDRLLLAADLRRALTKRRKAKGGVLEADFRRQDVRDIIAFIRGTNCGGM